jgi:hypothetical protein
MKSYKEILEQLKGKQHKIDKNKNGKIDAHDFKLLRKEESEEAELEEAAGNKPGWMLKADPKLGAAVKAAQDLAKKRKESYGNPAAGKSVKEEVEDLEERNKENAMKRKMMDASRGARYKVQNKGSGLRDLGWDDKHKTPQAQNKAIGRALRNEENDTTEKNEMAETQLHFIHYAAQEIMDFIKMGGEVEEWYQNKLSKVHSDMESLHSYIEGESRRTGMKEEAELEEGADYKVTVSHLKADKTISKHDYDVKNANDTRHAKNIAINRHTDKHGLKKGEQIYTDSQNVKQMAKEEVELEEAVKVGTKVKIHAPGKDYHDKMGSVGEVRHGAFKGAPKTYTIDYDGKSIQLDKKNIKLHKEEFELDEKLDMKKATMGDVIKDFRKSDAPQFSGKSEEKRRQMAIAAKLEADRGTRKEETEMLSYKDFMMMLEYESKSGVYRHSGSYGSEYAKKEREKDEKGFDSEPSKRGQKVGTKRGPKANLGSSKLHQTK